MTTAARHLLGIWLTTFLLCSPALAQSGDSASAVVPRLVNYSGKAIDSQGKAISGVAGITFSIYKDQDGGAPLWMETQNVNADAKGNYTIQLGAVSTEGLPLELFTSGEARWLGVRVNNGEEQPRILLLSVPYALKAADADTVGGLPASAFVLAAPPNSTEAATTGTAVSTATSSSAPASSSDVTTTGGTESVLPLFATATSIQNSLITQTGKSAINIGGKLNLFATGTATSSAGKNSQPQNFVASSYDSGTSAAVAQTFQWQAQPAGNDTVSPSATLNLLFGSGTTTPAETGLSIASNGRITFAKGQVFPGTGTGDGTITGVTAGTGLTGGGRSGSVTLSNAGVLGVSAGGGIAVGGTSQNPTIGINPAVVPQLTANNTFTGTTTIANTAIVTTANSAGALQVTNTTASGGAPGIVGTTNSTGASGVKGVASASSGITNGVYGISNSGEGTGVEGQGWTGVLGNSICCGGVGGQFNGFTGPQGGPAIIATGGNATSSTGTGGDGIYSNGGGGSFVDGSGGFFVGGVGGRAGDGVSAQAGSGPAGDFTGNVVISGTLTAGSKHFKIDHPLDPANKYLVHASVESSEMMNIYTGNVNTDSQGEATVQLPDWFEVLNTDFRYQLTVIGQFAQAIVSRKIANHQFQIRTNAPNVEVSWQVTGVRQDVYAKAHPLVVEEEKEAWLKGYYIHPDLYGQPEEKQIEWARHPQMMKKVQQVRQAQRRASSATGPISAGASAMTK